MATYEIYKKDGTPVRVQGPPNLSFKEVLSIYESGGKSAPSQPSVSQPRIKAREPDVLDRLGEIPKSVGRGVLNYLEDGIKGWTIPLSEGPESYLRDKITGGIGALREYTKPDLYFQQAQMDPNASFMDVVPNKFGEALGSFVGIGGTALIPGAGIPLAAGLVVGGGMEEQKQRAIAAGKLDQLSAREVLYGGAVGVTELIPIRLLRDGSKASLTVLNRLKRAFITGGVEGLQEASAQYAQNWIEQTGYNPQVELEEGTGEAFAYGDAVGFFVQGVMDLIAPRRGVRATTVAQELEDIGVTPKDDDPSTKAPGAPIVGEGGQFEFDLGKDTKGPKILSKEREAKELGVPTLTKKEIAQREKDLLKTDTEEQLEFDLRKPIEDKKPVKEEQLELDLPAPRKRPTIVEEDSGQIGFDFDKKPKNTKEAVEKIIKERVQEKENVASNIDKRTDGVSTKDSGQDAVSKGDIGIDSEGAKASTSDGLGNIGRDTRPDNVAEEQRDDTLTPLQKSILDTYRKTGVVPPFQDRSAKIFKRMGYDVKNQEDIANALKDLEAKDTTDTTQVEPPVATPPVAAQPKKGQMELFPGVNLGTTTRPEEVVEDQPDTPVTDPNQLEIDFNKKETQDLLSLVVDDTLPGFDEKNQKAIDYENETFDRDMARGEALAEAFKKIEKGLIDKGILEGRAIRRAIEKAKPKIKVTSDQAKEIIKKDKVTQKQIAKDKQKETAKTAEAKEKTAKKRAYEKDAPKRLEAKKIINDIYEGNAKKPQTGTQKGALLKEFHDNQELNKDTVDYKIISSDLASIGILMNTSDYKLKKEFPPKEGQASIGVSAKRYFTKSSNPNVVISMIIEDSLGDINYRADPEVSAAENAFYEFTGPKEAKNALLWIKENLGTDLNNTIEEKIKDSTTEIASEEFGKVILTSKTNAEVNAIVAKNEKQQDFNDALDKQGLLRGGLDPFKVDSDMRNFSLDNYGKGKSNVSLAAMKPTLNKMGEKGLDQSSTLLLSMPMYSMAQKALRGGQLKTALNIIAGKSYGKRNRELAKGFSKYIGSTKVEVVDNLRLKETGNKVSGLFDPQTNTIKLDSKTGLNNHTLFHELTHATTSATLANPSHPLSKQVTMLYNAVKDRLGTVYGSRNTEEFLAEAISNSEFRKDLATIYVKKEPYSSLDKFLHALNNFVRKYILGKETITLPDFKGYTQFRSPLGMFDITNAQEEVTRLVNEINAPSPKNRDAFELGLEDANAIITDLQNISEKQKGKYNPKKFAKEVTALATGTAGGLGARARQLLLQLLPMQTTGDLLNYQDRDGSKNFDGLGMQRVLFDQEAGIVKQSERIEGSIESIQRNIPRGKLDNFNKVVSLSSRFQVDPSKGRKAYEKDPEKLEVWQTMQPMWNELGDKGKGAYQDLRNVYVTMFNQLKDVIYGRIDGLDVNKGAKKQLKEKVYGQFFDRNNIEVYFPLVRTGSYWIEFQANDPNKNNALEQVIMAFESEGQRRKAISTLKSEYNIDAKAFQKTDAKTKVFDRAPSDSFMAQALDILQKGKIKPKIQDEFMNLFIESLPETSFAKSFSPRKGTLGFNEDAILALKTKGYNLARQIERLRHAPEIRKEIQRLEEVQRKNTSNIGFTSEIIEELKERGKFALNPPPDNLARNLNRFAFGMTLGLNISSSFVNFSQIPLVMLPYLGGKYGYGKSTKEIFKNFSILKNSGLSRSIATAIPDGKGGYKTQKVQAAPSWDNYYDLQKDGTYKIREDVKNNPKFKKEFVKEIEDMQALVEAASAQLGKSIFFDTLGIQGVKRGTSIFDSASMYSAFFFHQVERFNRQVALTTSYKLELDRLNGKGKYPPSEAEAKLSQKQKQQVAAQNAIYQAQKINGGSLLVTAPRLAQKGLWRVALMFKSYGIQMYATMFQIMYDGAYNAWKGLGSSDVEARRQARIALKQMIGITGSSIALAGIQGSIIGTFIWMANAVLWANGEEDETAESIVRGHLGEGWWKGPLVHYSGVDVSARIGLSNLLWRSNPYSGDQSMADKLLETFGGPAGSVLNQQSRAVGELASALQNKGGNYEKAFLGMLPVAIRNAYTGIFDYGIAGEATNRRGDAIIDDITKSEAVWKFMGFESKRKTFQQQYSQTAKNIERNVVQGKSLLLKRSNVARRQNDLEGMQRVEKAIAKYNRRYPLNMITLQDRMRSWKRFNETTQDIVGGVYINPRSRPIIDQNIGDWNMDTGLFDFI